jgi:hypothetical protein
MKSAIALPLAAMGALRYLQERPHRAVTGYGAPEQAVPKLKTGQRPVSFIRQTGEQGFQGVHAPR